MSFPFMFMFIVFAMCNMCKSEDAFKAVIEGDEVQLNFPYPCNSTRVTLQYGNRVPFYTLGVTESIVLPPVQEHRFTFKNESEHDYCSLNVIISPVMRVDAGTYIFSVYSEDGIYFESSFKRIGLDVDFLPGKASCTLNEEYTIGNWVTLNCMAPVGSLSGQIDCYQNGERMPPITPPIETLKHLKQSIHVNKEQLVFCCTSTWEYIRDMCNCNDFQWDPANDKTPSSIIDPCVRTTSARDLIETSDTTFTPSKPVSTTTTNVKINSHNGSVPWKYVVYGLGSILIIAGFVIILIVLMLRSRRKKKKILRSKCYPTSSQDQSKFYELIPNPNVHQCMLQRSLSI